VLKEVRSPGAADPAEYKNSASTNWCSPTPQVASSMGRRPAAAHSKLAPQCGPKLRQGPTRAKRSSRAISESCSVVGCQRRQGTSQLINAPAPGAAQTLAPVWSLSTTVYPSVLATPASTTSGGGPCLWAPSVISAAWRRGKRRSVTWVRCERPSRAGLKAGRKVNSTRCARWGLDDQETEHSSVSDRPSAGLP